MKLLKKLIAPFIVTAVMLIGLIPSAATAAPNFQMPFPCGQVWEGQTRTDHSPANAVDFNRTDDLGDTVVASAGGKVTVVRDLGDTSYGKYVVVDHGGGWTTYYAHLNTQSVSVGQTVTFGTKLGTVGSTGGSTGPHLHFEERYNGVAQKVVMNGAQALYWGSKSYTSKNGCSNIGGTVNTAGSALTVRSGPGTSYASVGSVADGQSVTIYCQERGTSVTGTYGTTTLWDKISSTSNQYISDAYVYTGSDGQVAPTCP
ncbi:M23 family metallopeptidase [Tumebacillus permanentifrigoris]|uniref:SH3 domain-containing protein n=1 Tax=Tumebacillus permanentifrigoris TaxID=378543 RepID=A0A316D5S9_9BACL|nr:M23 family metallopeptidase [Tumebacillus permanentifrigoris]PWK09021.1 SH3 domain-containing protein [Tumebacillus permanentifrigoris]